jgi:hypothetical protein
VGWCTYSKKAYADWLFFQENLMWMLILILSCGFENSGMNRVYQF